MPHCIKGSGGFRATPRPEIQENTRRAKSAAWLSLDHLRLPTDKSLNQQEQQEMIFACSFPGRIE
jgi:hypothetical protein